VERTDPASRELSPEDWERDLAREIGRPVRVSYGRATRDVLEARRRRGEVFLRMNARFAAAPAAVRAAIADWVRSGRRAASAVRAIDAWVDEVFASREGARRRLRPLEARGRMHDLAELAGELLERELRGDPRLASRPPEIGWGRRGARRVRSTLQLGTYDPLAHRIRIHPVLDQPRVPRFFVRAILFHELLHAAEPARRGRSGRWIHHDAAFRRREAAFADHARTLAWERANLAALLRSARSGADIPPPRAPRASRAPRVPLTPLASVEQRLVRGLQRLLFP
jgi:hypothetical protein